jgi:hypothetical protein
LALNTVPKSDEKETVQRWAERVLTGIYIFRMLNIIVVKVPKQKIKQCISMTLQNGNFMSSFPIVPKK